MPKILIVDDEKNMLTSLERLLQKDDLIMLKAANGKEAVKLAKKEKPDVILMDMQMPEMDGLTAFKEIRKNSPKQLVILMTGFGDEKTPIEAMKLGAYNYITKPFDIPKLQVLVDNAINESVLVNEVIIFDTDTETASADLKNRSIIGMSQSMHEIYKTIGQIASSDVPILLIGESGTGKELVARAIYQNSSRAQKQFLAINCAAIPDTLLESELFGYEKGSFTGANERKIGKFEQCDGGTIFLDEIGDMPMQTQAKILRVLQENELERIGGNETIKVDVRIISATNKDLKKQMEINKFREDLFYRLNVVQINLPALRQRIEDIPDLIGYFLMRYNKEFGKKITEIPKESMALLKTYTWPGNVRELENVIKRSIVMSVGNTLNIDHSYLTNNAKKGLAIKNSTQKLETSKNFHEFVSEVSELLLEKILALPDNSKERENLLGKIERTLIEKSIDKLNGNQVKIAKLLGITRNTLRSRIEKFDLNN